MRTRGPENLGWTQTTQITREPIRLVGPVPAPPYLRITHRCSPHQLWLVYINHIKHTFLRALASASESSPPPLLFQTIPEETERWSWTEPQPEPGKFCLKLLVLTVMAGGGTGLISRSEPWAESCWTNSGRSRVTDFLSSIQISSVHHKEAANTNLKVQWVWCRWFNKKIGFYISPAVTEGS